MLIMKKNLGEFWELNSFLEVIEMIKAPSVILSFFHLNLFFLNHNRLVIEKAGFFFLFVN